MNTSEPRVMFQIFIFKVGAGSILNFGNVWLPQGMPEICDVIVTANAVDPSHKCTAFVLLTCGEVLNTLAHINVTCWD